MRPEHCFHCVAEGIETRLLVQRIQQQPELWDEIKVRQNYPGTAHHSTESIIIRGPVPGCDDVFNDVACADYPRFEQALAPYLYDVLAKCKEWIGMTHDLGRVMIVNLGHARHIDAHVDEGGYADKYDRFHLALDAAPGNRFNVGDHTFEAQTGELWWFNHKLTHSVVNLSVRDRWHLIIDVVAPAYRMMRNRGLACA